MQAFVEQRYPPDSYSYSTLKELVLDGCKLKSLSREDAQFLSTFQSLVSLSCSCAGLTTLIGFPCFPSLKKLELQDNLLTSGANSGLDQLPLIAPNVRVLRLGGNKIKAPEELIQHLKALRLLEVLDVDKNLFNASSADWRPFFFTELPQLKSVDGRDLSGKSVEDDDDDDDEEEESIEDEEDEEDANALKAFYEKDYANDEDDEDQDEFNPINAEDDDEDFDENEGLEDDEEDGNENVVGNGSPHKRSLPDSSEQEREEAKRQKI